MLCPLPHASHQINSIIIFLCAHTTPEADVLAFFNVDLYKTTTHSGMVRRRRNEIYSPSHLSSYESITLFNASFTFSPHTNRRKRMQTTHHRHRHWWYHWYTASRERENKQICNCGNASEARAEKGVRKTQICVAT